MLNPEEKLIQKIKELRQEFENNLLMTPLILEYLVKKYVEEEYKNEQI
ncbi:hypothetical protein [Staphylococcus agnetis]|nr:hypothetical protein [Staphylococcus agnetis]MBY7664008.1 hypothetical protein [Staphylococcus agnetis]